ncbi:MAG: gfo/Idh/MocA family oxidoreductase [Alphaproteobacteria bacterium]|nr:MAG: gfo/Idh/MocA family oxidoreductase [Alphaproteobacteria bacterium]
MSRFTVAIAGFGWWGRNLARRVSESRGMRIAGIVEPEEANHGAIREMGLTPFTELPQVTGLDEVDAVILATPNPLHEEQIVHCARAGKHVFCEKPLGLTAASARRSVAACRAAGVQLGLGHMRRFEPAMQTLAAVIAAGEMGTIMHAEAMFSHDLLIGVPAGDWRTTKAVSPAAGMTAMGIHLTDLFIAFFGRVETVQAMTASRSLGWETGDVVTAQLRFEAGMTASLAAILHTPLFIRMHVFGTERWIQILNDAHPDDPKGKAHLQGAATGRPRTETVLDWVDTVSLNLDAFMRAATGEAPYPITPEEMIHNIEVLEAITISAAEGRTVAIAELSGRAPAAAGSP